MENLTPRKKTVSRSSMPRAMKSRLFTYKQDLRDTYPFGMFAVPQNKLDNRPEGIAVEDRRCFFAQVRLLERVMLNS
jgi:hypothetical protein